MKHLILDHLKRWGLVWLAVGIFNSCILNLDKNGNSNYISFPVILWLSAFALNFDLQRGSIRVLNTLPVSARQIGRAWWIISVALPTLFLSATVGLAMLLHSAGAAGGFPMNEFVVTASAYALYFGSLFYVMIGSPPGQPQTPAAWVRAIFTTGFIIGLFFIKPDLATPQGISFWLGAAILTVIGWFRAEQMVVQRAGFRLVAAASNKKAAAYNIPPGFGGWPYLMRRVFIQSTLIGLAMMASMTLFMSFLFHGKNEAHAIVSMIQSGSTPYVFFILIFSIVPLVFQLRFLRTLPASSSTLAATLVFQPVFSVAAVGLIVTAVVGQLLGGSVILPIANSFLLLGAKAAIIVPLIAWRGLDALAYGLIFLMVISDSLISLGMTILFHLGSNAPERPLWINLAVFLLCVGMSLILTQRLLTKSSSAYRVRTMPANAWSMARR